MLANADCGVSLMLPLHFSYHILYACLVVGAKDFHPPLLADHPHLIIHSLYSLPGIHRSCFRQNLDNLRCGKCEITTITSIIAVRGCQC